MLAFSLLVVPLVISGGSPVLHATGAAENTQFNEFFMADVLVTSVIDGDSIIIIEDGIEREIRLWGIDAPEYDQDGADDSRDGLRDLVAHKRVSLHIMDRDTYGRLVGIAVMEDVIINEHLVEKGLAWVHVYYCRMAPCKKWYRLETAAREKKLGLWNYDNPIPPWQWKREKSKAKQGNREKTISPTY